MHRRRSRPPTAISRDEINERLAKHGVADAASLDDEDAEIRLARLDRVAQHAEQRQRMRFAVSGVVEVKDDDEN